MYVYPLDNYEYCIILKIIINFHHYWRLDVRNVTICELSLVVEHFISNFKLIYQNIVRAIWQNFRKNIMPFFRNMTRMMKIVLCEYIIVYVSLIFEQKYEISCNSANVLCIIFFMTKRYLMIFCVYVNDSNSYIHNLAINFFIFLV